MTIQRIGSQQSQRAPAEHFTGTVRIDPLFQSSPPARAAATAMTHIAIQEALDGKAVEWLEKLTDDQYHGRK